MVKIDMFNKYIMFCSTFKATKIINKILLLRGGIKNGNKG